VITDFDSFSDNGFFISKICLITHIDNHMLAAVLKCVYSIFKKKYKALLLVIMNTLKT